MSLDKYQQEEVTLLMEFATNLIVERKITTSEEFFESTVYAEIKKFFDRGSDKNRELFKKLLNERKEDMPSLTKSNMDSCWTIFKFSVVQALNAKNSGITEMTATPKCADLFYDEADKSFLEHQSIMLQNRIEISISSSSDKAVRKLGMSM